MISDFIKKDLYLEGAPSNTYKRPQRVADMIRGEIGMLLLRKIKDPRLVNVTVVGVSVTKDLRRARISYSVFGDETVAKKVKDGLAKAKGFIRSHLAKELSLRVTPELEFVRDFTMARQEEMERLFKEIDRENEPAE